MLNVSPVHGDLHPDNVVIDRNGVPHLIDFAWAHKSRDVLIDYVLLENSIRFMAFAWAGAVNLSDQLKVDQVLLEEDGFGRISSIEFSSPGRRDDYSRLGCVVGVIRKRARALMGDRFSMQGYLLTQFILLYGLLRYDSYEPHVATRALGLIAARLKKIGLPTS
jgi:serine/threonine protein kinase